jgi:transposase InsO family protein
MIPSRTAQGSVNAAPGSSSRHHLRRVPRTRRAAYFAQAGITRIERLMTDNAWAYKYSLREICAALGTRQIFIRPHCPWQNGKAERFNRTLQAEWAYRRPTPPIPNEPPLWHPGSSTTTPNAPTPPSAANHRSAA